MVGLELYDIVCRYAALGRHRTGSPADRQTAVWLAELLQRQGATVTNHRFDFPKFDCDVHGRGSARGVTLEPLYYSAVGSHTCTEAHIASISFDDDHSDGGTDHALEQVFQEVKKVGAGAVIVATTGGNDDLCIINRRPSEAGRIPVALAAGRDLGQLQSFEAGIHFEATIKTSWADTLVARFAGPTEESHPLLITTPLSGWFSCAGERGTGIAIAIAVARAISAQTPVLLVMPSGHELGYYGARAFCAQFCEPVTSVLHLGSCIADRGAFSHKGAMHCTANLPQERFGPLSKALQTVGVTPVRPNAPLTPQSWMGESEVWAPRGLSMISIAGTSPYFHTPEDLPETATSPELLQKMEACVLDAARALIR